MRHHIRKWLQYLISRENTTHGISGGHFWHIWIKDDIACATGIDMRFLFWWKQKPEKYFSIIDNIVLEHAAISHRLDYQ